MQNLYSHGIIKSDVKTNHLTVISMELAKNMKKNSLFIFLNMVIINSRMGWTFTFLMCLVVAVHGFPQINLDELIGDLFQTENRSSQTQYNFSPTLDGNNSFGFQINHKNISK